MPSIFELLKELKVNILQHSLVYLQHFLPVWILLQFNELNGSSITLLLPDTYSECLVPHPDEMKRSNRNQDVISILITSYPNPQLIFHSSFIFCGKSMDDSMDFCETL